MASSQHIDSERYRQMLVRDGERRFREWHQEFLHHQQQYRASRQGRNATKPAPAPNPER